MPDKNEDRTKDELLTAIRKQAEAAGRDLPRTGAAALRDLAEAYSVITAVPLPMVTGIDGDRS
ncbi:hypothetical protein [Streptomyces sp. NPDC002952]|uniref:hypothetical protein n=1 Tax=Streptomyces sp. NPDC002952 TaxID=3364673 RepID=UPI0036B0CAA2